MVKSLIFKNSNHDKEQLSWSEYLRLLLAFIYNMFGSVKNKENGKVREENWGENIIHPYLVEVKTWRKENDGARYFSSEPTKMYLSELERTPCRKWKKKSKWLFYPCSMLSFSCQSCVFLLVAENFHFLNTAADMKREFGKLLRSSANGELVRLMNSGIEKRINCSKTK